MATTLKHIFVCYHKNSPLQSMVSMFPAYIPVRGKWVYKGAENTWYKKDKTLLEIFKLIKSDAFKPVTDTFRSLTDEKEAKQFKKKRFDYACFSGTFDYRSEKKLIKHSGLICIDVDKLNADVERVRNIVNSDPLTIMSFVSPSGNGLKVIYKINPEKRSQSDYYQYLSDYISKMCGLPKKAVDDKCKDVSRACFLPHDPTCYLNFDLL